MTHPIPDRDADEAEVIISGTQILANSPPKTTITHFLSGANGQSASFIQGTPADLTATFDLAKARGRRWGPKLFIFAPGKQKKDKNGKKAIDREFVKTVAWPMIASTFGVPAEEGIIVEHDPLRPEDDEHTHWHIGCHHHDPVTNRFRNWSWDRAKMERCSRVIEVITESRILTGRFQTAVIRHLREMGEHDFADAIAAATPPDAEPAARTPRRQIEQPAKRKGIDLRKHDHAVREVYQASANITELRAKLAEIGLSLVASHRIPDRPVWVIHNADGFVRSLGGSLPKVTQTAIQAKIGAPKDNDEQLDIIDAIAAAGPGGDAARLHEGGYGDHEIHRQGARVEGSARDAPDGTQLKQRESLAGLLARVVTEFDPGTVKEMEQQADRIMVSPLQKAIDYLRRVITRAKSYLESVLPPKSPSLVTGDEILISMNNTADATQEAISDQAKKIKVMEMVLPAGVGAKAHNDRIASARESLAALEGKLEMEKESIAKFKKVHAQFEAEHAIKVDNVEKKFGKEIGAHNLRIRVAERCTKLLDAHPQIAPLGAPMIFYRGIREDIDAKRRRERKHDGWDDDFNPPTVH